MTTLNTIIEEENEHLYCEHCKGCGEVGCDGIETFLNKHVRGKTDCLYEESYINDIIEMYKEDTTAIQRAYEAGKAEERAKIREEICMAIANTAGMVYPHKSPEANALWKVLDHPLLRIPETNDKDV